MPKPTTDTEVDDIQCVQNNDQRKSNNNDNNKIVTANSTNHNNNNNDSDRKNASESTSSSSYPSIDLNHSLLDDDNSSDEEEEEVQQNKQTSNQDYSNKNNNNNSRRGTNDSQELSYFQDNNKKNESEADAIIRQALSAADLNVRNKKSGSNHKNRRRHNSSNNNLPTASYGFLRPPRSQRQIPPLNNASSSSVSWEHHPSTSSTTNNTNTITTANTHTWDGFVRHGTRLKTLLGDAMTEVKSNLTTPYKKRARESDQEEDTQTKSARKLEETSCTVAVARQKTAEVLDLQRQLTDAQAQAATNKAANASMREENVTLAQRLERTVEALRIAGTNAAKARGDADSAEATAASMAQKLQSLQTVVTETKRASRILHEEQQQVQTKTVSLQAKILQKEGNLVRAHKELQIFREKNEELEGSHQKWKDEMLRLEKTVQEQTQELDKVQREKQERDALEEARKQRAEKVEQEWRQAQSMLMEATAGQAQAEQTQTLLEETISKLQKTNTDLHEQLSKQQNTSRQEHQRLSEALTKAEKEAQRLRIESEAFQEDIQRYRMDKASAEKQISQLKNHLTKLERNLKEKSSNTSNSMVSPDPMSTTSYNMTTPFSLPPSMASSEKENGSAQNNITMNASDTCSICFKKSFGLMKKCQCGEQACWKRAHASCVNRIHPGPSVSHPGTPAPRLPLVLCSGSGTTTKTRSSDVEEGDDDSPVANSNA